MISVCIATYNGETYICEQLDSILSQISGDDEIIISDDSSTDRTVEIIESYDDSRIKLYRGQKYQSPIFNFENALRLAVGDYIFLSDQDDIWAVNKVTKMIQALQTADMVVCDCTFIDNEKKIIVPSYFAIVNSSPGLVRNLRKNTYFGCCMAFRKNILKKALPFPKDIPMHDIWLGFVSDLFYKSVFLDERLTFYRKHDTNASIASDIKSNISIMNKIKFRYNTIKHIFSLLLR